MTASVETTTLGGTRCPIAVLNETNRDEVLDHVTEFLAAPLTKGTSRA